MPTNAENSPTKDFPQDAPATRGGARDSAQNSSENSPAPQVIYVPVPVVVVPVPVPIPVPASENSPNAGVPEKSPKTVPADGAHETPHEGDFRAGVPHFGNGALARFWRRAGGTGFVVSALFHFALFIFALFYVFAEIRVSEPDEAAFVSGAGGQSAGISRNQTERAFRMKPRELSQAKIVSQSAAAKIAMPALPKFSLARKPARGAGTADFSENPDGNGSGGSGDGNSAAGTANFGGLGGGAGTGLGVGIGEGKNFLGKFKTLLGAKIQAQKIAVYLDCSGSMRHWLEAVKAEIYEKFPDADIFAYSGAGTEVIDGAVVGGRAMRAKTLAAIKKKRADDETETAKLSGAGRVIYKKFAANFAAGTAGAWLDVMSRERYDALVIFSDFRDGIRQRRGSKTVYADSTYSPAADARTEKEKRWEKEWTDAFSRKGAPKLYLFSVRPQVQDFLEKCASASGGSVTILDLKKKSEKTGRGKKRTSKSDENSPEKADGNGSETGGGNA